MTALDPLSGGEPRAAYPSGPSEVTPTAPYAPDQAGNRRELVHPLYRKFLPAMEGALTRLKFFLAMLG